MSGVKNWDTNWSVSRIRRTLGLTLEDLESTAYSLNTLKSFDQRKFVDLYDEARRRLGGVFHRKAMSG